MSTRDALLLRSFACPGRPQQLQKRCWPCDMGKFESIWSVDTAVRRRRGLENPLTVPAALSPRGQSLSCRNPNANAPHHDLPRSTLQERVCHNKPVPRRLHKICSCLQTFSLHDFNAFPPRRPKALSSAFRIRKNFTASQSPAAFCVRILNRALSSTSHTAFDLWSVSAERL